MQAGELVGGKYVLGEHLLENSMTCYWTADCPETKKEQVLLLQDSDVPSNLGFSYDPEKKIEFKVYERQPRDLLKRYELVNVIGKGSSKTVWRALDLFKKRTCAFLLYKDLNRDQSADELLSQIRKEYIHLCEIDHPNVIKVFDIGMYDEKRPFMTQQEIIGKNLSSYHVNLLLDFLSRRNIKEKELVDLASYIFEAGHRSEGKRLNEFIEKMRQKEFFGSKLTFEQTEKFFEPLGGLTESLEELIEDIVDVNCSIDSYMGSVENILGPVLNGLKEVHEKKIIHRDIRLENIVVDFLTHEPILIDFGLSVGTDPLYNTGGGVLYKAPEVILNQDYSVQSDIWAFGVVAYCLLSGKFPFSSSNIEELNEKIVSQEIVPLREHVGGIPKELESVVLKCLEKDKCKRYASCEEIDSDL